MPGSACNALCSMIRTVVFSELYCTVHHSYFSAAEQYSITHGSYTLSVQSSSMFTRDIQDISFSLLIYCVSDVHIITLYGRSSFHDRNSYN